MRFCLFYTGQYAYISPANIFTDTGQVGRLISTKIPTNAGDKCVSFYYEMNGKHIGYLDFFIRTMNTKKFYTYWSVKGHHGNYWQRGAFTIPNRNEPYEVWYLLIWLTLLCQVYSNSATLTGHLFAKALLVQLPFLWRSRKIRNKKNY